MFGIDIVLMSNFSGCLSINTACILDWHNRLILNCSNGMYYILSWLFEGHFASQLVQEEDARSSQLLPSCCKDISSWFEMFRFP
jgi:hypothetical protein